MTQSTIYNMSNRIIDHFEEVYNFTLRKLYQSGQAAVDAPLHILQLLTENPPHQAVHALELWLFCEARKICLATQNIKEQEAVISQQITQRFLQKSDSENSGRSNNEIDQLVKTVIQNMGFSTS